MALAANLKNGKAVADVRALYFYKHSGTEPAMADMLDKDGALISNWFAVLSLRGTVNAGQDAPSIEKILVDQFDTPIGITTEPGDFTFEATLPGMTYNDLAKWLTEGTDIEKLMDGESTPAQVLDPINGKEVFGINLNGQLFEVSAMIQTRTNDTIIFTRAQISLTFAKEDKTFVFKVSGQVVAPLKDGNYPMYLATESPA